MKTTIFLSSLLLFSVGLCDGAKNQDYVIEALTVTDLKAAQNFRTIGYQPGQESNQLSFLNFFMMYEINRYLDSLEKYGAKLEVRTGKNDAVILNDEFFKGEDFWTDEKDNIKGLKIHFAKKAINKWMKKEGKKSYDLVIFWTGYDLYDENKKYAGWGNVDKVCQGDKALVIVSFHGTQSTARTTAHAIGNTISIFRDKDCLIKPQDQESGILATKEIPRASEWKFPDCHAKHADVILQIMNIVGKKCLTTTTMEKPSNDFNPDNHRKDNLGDIFRQREVCARELRAKHASPCIPLTHEWQKKKNNFCETMYCRSSVGECVPVLPTEGLPCYGHPDYFSKDP